MRIAIPMAAGKLAAHFGHCEQFALLDVDPEAKTIISTSAVDAPPHEPGLLPGWLSERGANVIIAGGMGQRVQQLFAAQDIQVVIGVSAATPETVVQAYLDGSLQSGPNLCDH
ncbi:MAG: NifB/NifX family molybdenum-iron cluster-binding protein [bacterium]